MDDEILAGVELLNYSAEFLRIGTDLEAANRLAEETIAALRDGSAYLGKAQEGMLAFAIQLSRHIKNLQGYYYKAGNYAADAYESFYKSDEAMSAWLQSNNK